MNGNNNETIFRIREPRLYCLVSGRIVRLAPPSDLSDCLMARCDGTVPRGRLHASPEKSRKQVITIQPLHSRQMANIYSRIFSMRPFGSISKTSSINSAVILTLVRRLVAGQKLVPHCSRTQKSQSPPRVQQRSESESRQNHQRQVLVLHFGKIDITTRENKR